MTPSAYRRANIFTLTCGVIILLVVNYFVKAWYPHVPYLNHVITMGLLILTMVATFATGKLMVTDTANSLSVPAVGKAFDDSFIQSLDNSQLGVAVQRQCGILTIKQSEIIRLLGLPDDVEITKIDYSTYDVEITVKHNLLVKIALDEPAPYVRPVFVDGHFVGWMKAKENTAKVLTLQSI